MGGDTDGVRRGLATALVRALAPQEVRAHCDNSTFILFCCCCLVVVVVVIAAAAAADDDDECGVVV